MFVCLSCHKNEKEWPNDGWFNSYGRCEVCGLVDECLDCHGHRKTEEKEDGK